MIRYIILILLIIFILIIGCLSNSQYQEITISNKFVDDFSTGYVYYYVNDNISNKSYELIDSYVQDGSDR